MTTVWLQLDDAYLQLAKNLRGETIPQVELPRHSTRSIVAQHLATSLASDETSVWLRPKKTRSDRLLLQDFANETVRANSVFPRVAPTEPDTTKSPNTNLPIHVHTQQEKTRPLRRQPAAIREDLRRLAEETIYHGPPFAVLPAQSLQGYLPTVRGSMLLELIDIDDVDRIAAKIENVDMLWDSGAHISYISSDLVSEQFNRQLRDPGYLATYQWGSAHSGMCMVDAELEFSNCRHSLAGLVVVCPKDQMPNNYSGVLLRQRSILDRMMYLVQPRAILVAQGIVVPEDIWGQINIKAYISLPGEGGELVELD
jgi:hypothetical protein